LLFSLQLNEKGCPKKLCLRAPALESSDRLLGTSPAPSTLHGALLLTHPAFKSCLRKFFTKKQVWKFVALKKLWSASGQIEE